MLDDQQLARLAQAVLPHSRVLRTWPLTGGISAEMAGLELEGPDGGILRLVIRRPGVAVLRHNPRAAQDEFRLLEITRVLGLATPRPYYVDPTGEILSTPGLVMAYIDGGLEFTPPDPLNYARQMGRELARIHTANCVRLDLSFLPRPGRTCVEVGQPAGQGRALEEGRIRAVLESGWPLVTRNAPVLLHGDFWPGNVLWRDEALAAVIDWEDACLGDPLTDLAISRLDLLWIIGRDAMEAFTHEYRARVEVDDTDLPYWDLCAALRLSRLVGTDLDGWADFFLPYGRPDITARSIREGYQYFVSQALVNRTSPG